MSSTDKKVGQFPAVQSPPILAEAPTRDDLPAVLPEFTLQRKTEPTADFPIAEPLLEDYQRVRDSGHLGLQLSEIGQFDFGSIEIDDPEFLELQVEEISDQYLGKITISSPQILDVIKLVYNSAAFSIFQPWKPTVQNGDTTSFYIAYSNPTTVLSFISGLANTNIHQFESTDKPEFKVFRTKYGMIPLPNQTRLLSKSETKNLNHIQPKKNHAINTTLQHTPEVLSQTEIATLTIDLSELSEEEITDILWKQFLQIYAANKNIVITGSTSGTLSLINTSERGESELIQLAHLIKEKLPKLKLRIETSRIQSDKSVSFTETDENKTIPPHSGVCIVSSKLIKKLAEARALHQVSFTYTETADGNFELKDINYTPKLRATKMIGEPHQNAALELTNKLNSGKKELVYIVGPSGSGKSTVIANSLQEIEDPERIILVTSFNPLNSSLQGLGFINICHQILTQAKDQIELLKPEHRNKLLEAINTIISHTIHHSRDNLPKLKKFTLNLLRQISKVKKNTEPHLLVIEDRHFIDPVSAKYLKEFIDEINEEDQPELNYTVIVSTRPISEQVITSLAEGKATITIPPVPFTEDRRTFTKEFIEMPLPSNIKLAKVVNHQLVQDFVLNYISRELSEGKDSENQPSKVNTENFYRLIRFANGNPYESEMLIKMADFQNAIYSNNHGELDINEDYLIKIETSFSTNQELPASTTDTTTSTINQIRLNQVQLLPENSKKIIGILGLAKKLSFEDLKIMLDQLFNEDEESMLNAISHLQKWGFLEITGPIGNSHIQLSDASLISIGVQYLNEFHDLTEIAKKIISIENIQISSELKFRLYGIIAKSKKIYNEAEVDFWSTLIEQIQAQLTSIPTTAQARSIFTLLFSIPAITARITELNSVANHTDKSKSTNIIDKLLKKSRIETSRKESTPIDQICVLGTLVGLLSLLADNDPTLIEKINTQLRPIFQSNSSPELYSQSAEKFYDLLYFNYYIANNQGLQGELLVEQNTVFNKQKLSHTIYYLYRLKNKKIDRQLLDSTIDPKKRIKNRKTLIGKTGYEAAIYLLNTTDHGLDLSQSPQEQNEIDRIKLRIPFEQTRRKYEEMAEKSRDSKEYYPLPEPVTPDDLQKITQRIIKLKKLLKEYKENPNSFHNFTKLWILEQLVQEKMLLLESEKKVTNKIRRQQKTSNELLSEILLELDELAEFALNSNEFATAARALRISAHLNWYSTFSVQNALNSQILTNVLPPATNPFARIQTVLAKLLKAIQVLEYSSNQSNPNYELVCLDFFGFTATILSQIEDNTFSSDGLFLLVRTLNSAIEIIEKTEQHFGKEKYKEIDPYTTYEWGAIGCIIQFLERLVEEQSFFILDDPAEEPLQASIYNDELTISPAHEKPITIKFTDLIQKLKSIVSRNLDPITIQQSIDNAKKLEIDKERNKAYQKESPTGIVDTYLVGLEYLRDNCF